MLSKFSVKKPYTVIVGIVLSLILGFVSFTNLTTDLLPKMELPYVIIMTTYPGASSEKVEKGVTTVIEQAVATSTGIKDIQSVSSDNSSTIILQYEDDTDMNSTIVDLNSKINMVEGYFDDAVSTPYIIALNPNMLPIMEVAFSSDLSQAEMSRLIEDKIKPEIEKIDGVASVDGMGILQEGIEIRINQDKIDEINDQVLKSVDEKLWEAQQEIRNGYKTLNEKQQELNDGKYQIEEGKNTLNNTQTETINSLADATVKLDGANAQLQAVLAHETDLNTDKTALTTEKTMLEQGKIQAQTALTQMQTAQVGVNTLVSAYVVGGGNTTDPIANLEAIDTSGTITTLVATFSAQGVTISTIDDLTNAITNSITTLQNTIADIDTRVEEIEEELRNIETELTASAMVKTQLQNQIDQLNTAKKELEAGKLTATIKFSEAQMTLSTTESTLAGAQAQIDSARTQLDDAQKQLNESKEEAYKQADISGTLTPAMISQILMAENFSMPAGTVVTGDNTSVIVKIGDEFSSLEELQDLTLFNIDVDGVGEVKLSDVADVYTSDNADSIYAKLNGNMGAILTVQKTSTASTTSVTNRINNEFENIESNYGVKSTVLMDQGVYINLIVDSVINNLLQGALLAIVILLLFLKDWRPTFIIAISIPISLMVAIVAMYFSGVTLNIMSLSGLALGVGMLVDNSIVVIENIYRLRKEGMPLLQASVDGAKQVAGAIFASTLTTICVFLPIIFAKGIAKQLFVDMGLTIAYSLLASLLIALTVVPMLGSKMLNKTSDRKHIFIEKMTNGYANVLEKVLHHKAILLVSVLALFIFCCVYLTTMPTSFIPDVASSQMSITLNMNNEKATAEETRSATDTFVERALEISDISDIGAYQSSSSSLLMGASSSDTMNIYVILNNSRQYSTDELVNMLNKDVEDLDCTLDISTSNMDTSALGGSGITINVLGNDMDELYEVGNSIKDKLSSVEGIDTITVGDSRTTPEKRIVINKNKAMEYGLTVAQIYQAIAADLSSATKSTTITIDNIDYPVTINTEKDIQSDLYALNNYEVSGKEDGEDVDIRLNNIADYIDAESALSINRDNQQRTIPVSITIKEDYNVGLVSKDIEKVMNKIEIPNDVTIDISGENETIVDTMFELVKMLALAIALIYLIMVAQFQNLKSPFIVMFTIPLAFTGGLLALILTGSELSIISILGFLVLSGVVVNNGIVFIDTTNQLRESGMDKKAALIQTGKTRLRPILMTALTTILAMSTMALGVGEGAQMMAPMAIVTIGGLVYATFMTLFVVPALYDAFQRKDIKKIEVE